MNIDLNNQIFLSPNRIEKIGYLGLIIQFAINSVIISKTMAMFLNAVRSSKNHICRYCVTIAWKVSFYKFSQARKSIAKPKENCKFRISHFRYIDNEIKYLLWSLNDNTVSDLCVNENSERATSNNMRTALNGNGNYRNVQSNKNNNGVRHSYSNGNRGCYDNRTFNGNNHYNLSFFIMISNEIIIKSTTISFRIIIIVIIRNNFSAPKSKLFSQISNSRTDGYKYDSWIG